MEAADSTSNSSQVIVQCHDPSNVFDKIVGKLESRLPLNKLHWKSPNRPLRSIDQLNVSFVRDESRSDGPTNARRHQIPGLRQTPFVKVFLLRCDDREAYKELSRKEVKQWLKGQGFSQDGKNLMKGQERHDAYEYIILHVVLPGTTAASQPKSSKHVSLDTYDSTDSVNSKSKWTGKSSSTIYDKMRADFASSSKAPFERVAQVRVTDPSTKQSGGLGPSELEELWQDFVEKLKTAILLSFDARVSQYEEDIREREAQRQMPGWNFCTFFILKEGLARGFENVGLIDDALTIYDELDAGLDTLVQEQASREEPDPTSALLPFSTDLKPAIRSALDDPEETDAQDQVDLSHLALQNLIELERKNFPFDVERKNYQQRILTNQVSALDFHVYIFTRQLQLLFRQARLSSVGTRITAAAVPISGTHADLTVVADICERATSFITFAARALRRDLYNAWGGQEGLDDEELRTQRTVVSGLVASWKWVAIMQILADCQVLHFLRGTLMGEMSSEQDIDGEVSNHVNNANGNPLPATQDLALWVGELVSMIRDILQSIISLSKEQKFGHDAIRGLQLSSLHSLYLSTDEAFDLHQLLTICTYQCFQAAGRVNASHRMIHALAQTELEKDNLVKATWWLEQIPNLGSMTASTATDRALLNEYAKCLKKLDRYDEYAQALVTLLLSSAISPISRALPRYDEQTQQILNELITISDKISETTLTLGAFVAIRAIAKCIAHDDRGIGFSLAVSVSLRFNASIDVSEIELTMDSVNEGFPQITLRGPDILSLNSSTTIIQLQSNITAKGWFTVSQLRLKVGRLGFVHNFQNTQLDEQEHNLSDMTRPDPIMIYPSSSALSIDVKPSSVVDLRKPGNFLFEINVGNNDVDECSLRIRPATAGIRVNIQAAQSVSDADFDDLEIVRQNDVSVVVLRDLIKGSKTFFEVPFSAEIPTASVSLRIEAQCSSSDASIFSVFYQRQVNINLPISVNVQDVFQPRRLFSRFTAAPSTVVPLKLHEWSIDENDVFDIKHNQLPQIPLDVLVKMPASWVIETQDQETSSKKQLQLPLSVQYQTYDDLILNSIETAFWDFMQSNIAGFANELLLSHLLAQVPSLWTEQELETAVLLQEFEMYSYNALNWDDILKALDITVRKQVEHSLRMWHEEHEQIDLTSAQARTRVVRLSVEMPKPSVIVSTHLKLDMNERHFLAVGEAVSAILTLECVCGTESEIDLQFEVANQPDTWLVGGKKRGSMQMVSGSSTFQVLLIAQKTGYLLLPSIEVKCRRPGDRDQASLLNFEVEGKSQTTSVLVMPSLLTTTIAIGTDATSSRHWPLESRRRQMT